MSKANKKRNSNGEGTIFFDERNKRWRCQISYKTFSGASARKSISGKTKTEVINKRNKLLSEIAKGRITETTNATVVDLLREDAKFDYDINAIKDASYNRRIFTINIIEKSLLGSIPIVKIQEKQINAFLISLKATYSNSVISKVYSALSKAYNLAINKQLMSYNLMDSPFIKRPISDKQDKRIDAFTLEEEKTFLTALSELKLNKNAIDYRPLFYIELFAGLRMGEICALTPKDIDFINGVIHVRNTVTRGIDYEIKLGNTTKTNKGVRDVPINSCLVPVLKKALSEYRKNDDNLLFYNFKSNRPISTQQANSAFSRICKKANINVSGGQHLLRHTFATRAIESGVSANVLKNWMGHSDISITLNTYCNVFDKMNNKAMDMFENYCKGNLSL